MGVKLFNKILFNSMMSKGIVVFLLKVHQKVYSMLGKFASIAEGGLHPKHRLMDYHKFFVDNLNESDSILDLGCGNGALTFDLAKKARFVKAIDKSRENIEYCNKKYPKENIKYLVGDITKDLPEEKFNAIVLSNLLEHIDDRGSLLASLHRISDKIIVRVPMLDRDWVTLYRKELGLPYLLDPAHKTEYTLDIFKEELERNGFMIQKYSIRFGEIWAVCSKKIGNLHS